MFLANTFGYKQRRALAEHAYQQTRADLRARRGTLRTTLQRHGVRLDDAVLDDAHRRLIQHAKPRHRPAVQTLKRLDEVLNELESALPRS
jgi:hypothetical protein